MDIVPLVLARNKKLVAIEAIFYSTICLDQRNQDVLCATKNIGHLGLLFANNFP